MPRAMAVAGRRRMRGAPTLKADVTGDGDGGVTIFRRREPLRFRAWVCHVPAAEHAAAAPKIR